MGLTELLYDINPAEIGAVVLDASVRELHRARAKATRHPVEADSGKPGEISDHVQVEPLSVQIEGVVTDTPAVDPVSVLQLIGTDPVMDAHQELLRMVLLGQIVTVVTSLTTYSNMLLESVDVTRDADKGNALYFSATATQITLVTVEEIELEQRPPVKAIKVKGRASAKVAPPAAAAESASVFGKLADALLP